MDSKNLTGPSPIPNKSKKSYQGGAGAPPSAFKRKVEDYPPLMGSSPLLGWSPFVKFMVISSQDNRKVAKVTFQNPKRTRQDSGCKAPWPH